MAAKLDNSIMAKNAKIAYKKPFYFSCTAKVEKCHFPKYTFVFQ